MTSRFLRPCLFLLGLAACDAPLDPEALHFRDELMPVVDPGTWPQSGGGLNTAWLGDMRLMRLLPPGSAFLPEHDDGLISLIEVFDDGQYVPVTDVAVPNGTLSLTTAGGTYVGEETEGSRWWLDAAKTEYIMITEVSDAGPALEYELVHGYADDNRAALICSPSIHGDTTAYLVEDVFVNTVNGSITPANGPLLVACRSGALGKAITWGFSPWYTGNESMELYRTGVRTVMADYCGDATSHTQDGTYIQVSNALAELSFVDEEASTEAIFGPDGALCLSEPRSPQRRRGCTLSPCEEPVSLEPFHAWTKLAPELAPELD